MRRIPEGTVKIFAVVLGIVVLGGILFAVAKIPTQESPWKMTPSGMEVSCEGHTAIYTPNHRDPRAGLTAVKDDPICRTGTPISER